MISVESYNTFIEMFCVAHGCTVTMLDDVSRPINKVIFNYKGHEHNFEMPLRQDMSLDDLGLIFHDEWENSGFDNITTTTKEPGSPDAGEDWYKNIKANPDITDPMAAYEKIDAENKPDICPYCNVGGDNMKDVAEITDGELHASCWVDVDCKTQDPIMSIDISILDGISVKYDTQIKFGSNKINFCPMCGRKLKED